MSHATTPQDNASRDDPGEHPREQCRAVETEEGDILIHEPRDGHRWIKSSVASQLINQR